MSKRLYHIATYGDFEDYDYEGNGAILEIQADSLQEALEAFVKHFAREDILDYEVIKPAGPAVVYTRGHIWTFVQRAGCPFVWGLLDVAEWQPQFEDEFGDIGYGITQEEYNEILLDRQAAEKDKWAINAYLSR